MLDPIIDSMIDRLRAQGFFGEYEEMTTQEIWEVYCEAFGLRMDARPALFFD